MLWLILIILGIVALILKANAILLIPNIVLYVLFGFAGLQLLIQIVVLVTTHRRYRNRVKKFNKKFNKEFDSFF